MTVRSTSRCLAATVLVLTVACAPSATRPSAPSESTLPTPPGPTPTAPSTSRPSQASSAPALAATTIAGSLVLKITRAEVGLGVMYVYSDGLVVVLGNWGADGWTGPRGVTRLSPSGLDLLLSTASETAVLDGEDISPVVGGGLTVYEIEVTSDPETTLARQVAAPVRKRDRAEANEFIALVERLVTPDRWLPATGWIDTDPAEWIPSRFKVSIEVGQRSTTLDLQELADIDWPFAGGPRGFGQADADAADWVEVARCATVSLEDSLALGAALGLSTDQAVQGIDIELRDGTAIIELRATALLPDDPSECSPFP